MLARDSGYAGSVTDLQRLILISLKNDATGEIQQFDIGRFGLDHNPAAVYIARLAPKSRRSQLGALKTIAEILTSGRQDALSLQWWHLRYQHTAALRSLLADRYAPATANRMLAALRATLKECFRLGLMSAEDHAKATDIQTIKSNRLPSGRALRASEIAALMKCCIDDPTPAGYRDAALIAIACAGLRRSEIVKLALTDFDPESGGLTVRSGKGRKDRVCYLSAGGRCAVNDWLKIRGNSPGALLLSVDRFGRLGSVQMADQSVLTVLRKRTKQAGLEHFSPHDLRRTYISNLLDAGADISTVQKLVGHSDPGTTARYDRRGEEAKQAAALLMELPYQR